jgi:hypothetical protein
LIAHSIRPVSFLANSDHYALRTPLSASPDRIHRRTHHEKNANRSAQARLNAVKTALIETETRLATSGAAFEARQEMLRSTINEARDREKAARTQADVTDQRHLEATNALAVALEEKAAFESKVCRIDEMRITIADRDAMINSLNSEVGVSFDPFAASGSRESLPLDTPHTPENIRRNRRDTCPSVSDSKAS